MSSIFSVHVPIPLLFAVVAVLIAMAKTVRLWIRSRLAGAPIPLFQLFLMRMRKVDAEQVVGACIQAHQAGIELDARKVEELVMAGGHPERVVQCLIAARGASLELSFDTARALDLGGFDAAARVRDAIRPRPLAAPEAVEATAGDGVRLRIGIAATVQGDLSLAVGGRDEQALASTLVQGLRDRVQAAPDHQELLRSPGILARSLLASGLDQDCFLRLTGLSLSPAMVAGAGDAATERRQPAANRQAPASGEEPLLPDF